MGHESNLPMGVCVTDGIRRRAPDVVRTALTLHQLCRGGFTLGIGAGEAGHLTPFCYDFTTPVSDLEEFLNELVTLLNHSVMPTGFSGRTGLPLRRDDLGPPKVWVAAHGPRMLRLAGEYGDGWVPAWPMSASSYGEKLRVIAEHADRAGRPMPECGLHVAVILGRSRNHVVDLMERDPLCKLTALFCSAEIWAKYGMQHPGGDKCRGLVDLIQHDLDPEELRELAPTIPFELVEEFMFVGNATEIADRVSGYADNGLEHVILGNATGTVGGLDEINSTTGELVALVTALGKLR
jgi:phthiodiolone/phenolphthiodiolone dimycocerosates ketoreductase